jgi:hypothetical protein
MHTSAEPTVPPESASGEMLRRAGLGVLAGVRDGRGRTGAGIPSGVGAVQRRQTPLRPVSLSPARHSWATSVASPTLLGLHPVEATAPRRCPARQPVSNASPISRDCRTAAMTFPRVEHRGCVTQPRDDLLRLVPLPSCGLRRKSFRPQRHRRSYRLNPNFHCRLPGRNLRHALAIPLHATAFVPRRLRYHWPRSVAVASASTSALSG